MTAPSKPASGSPAATGSGAPFNLDRAWRLNPKVALRPEPFGALLYHFGTRKLSFLKNLVVVSLVKSLDGADSAEAAFVAAGIVDADRPLYVQALSALADSGMIIPAEPSLAAEPSLTEE
ncbi:mycofactocin biosynthesis chaperone MftB [Gordonia sp. (in: high G+C Gram-positive bacteria)]|uniref:mycofactocin biosynthesis chaperone MftB n=1 Tax=Gordonia sp. (in: high G+C Gram-positive bacteria) TaxID=84139 RepID=UPI003C760C76